MEPSTTCYAWAFTGPPIGETPYNDPSWIALPNQNRVATRATTALQRASTTNALVLSCTGELDGVHFRCHSSAILIDHDATPALRLFARYCARTVAHLWSPMPLIEDWLRTGAEELRARVHQLAWAVSGDLDGVARLAARVAMYASHESLIASATREAARLALVIHGSCSDDGREQARANQERVLAAAILRGVTHTQLAISLRDASDSLRTPLRGGLAA